MPESFKLLAQLQLAAAAATIYTAPALTQAVIKQINIVNTDTLAHTYQLFQGGTAAVNAITPVVTLQGGEWAEFNGNILVDAADTLAAASDAATVMTTTVYGLEVS